MKARLYFVLLIMLLACAGNAFGQGARGQGLRRLLWPDKDWSVDVAVPGFDVAVEDFVRNNSAYWLFATLRTDKTLKLNPVILRIQLEAAQTIGGATEFRDFAIKRYKKADGMRNASIKTFEYKQIPVIRYTMDFPAVPYSYPYSAPPASKMRGLDAFFVKDDVWITFSIHAVSLTKEEENLLYKVLDSVKFTDTSKPSTSFDYYYKAKSLIQQKQNTQAVEQLNLALDLEQEERRLDDEHWRNLIGQLFDYYFAAGDHARVRELLNYGIKLDPTFPLFHLSMAHHFTALDDVDNTIAALEKAYLYRKNDPRTAFWIDPLKHPSFERFRKNEKFRKAAKALKK